MMADPTKASDTKGKGTAKGAGTSGGGKPPVDPAMRTAQKGSTPGGGGSKS